MMFLSSDSSDPFFLPHLHVLQTSSISPPDPKISSISKGLKLNLPELEFVGLMFMKDLTS